MTKISKASPKCIASLLSSRVAIFRASAYFAYSAAISGETRVLPWAPCIWRNVAPGRRFTRLPELAWASQLGQTLSLQNTGTIYILPKSTCVTFYNTMVLPLFDYRAVVWDSCGQGSKPYSDKLNHRAALCN